MILILKVINLTLGVLFSICFCYQAVFQVLGVFRRPKRPPEGLEKRYAFLISARNEEDVIGRLIDSILAQDYPKEKIAVFVIADNCTDSTAEVAERHGATVYHRFSRVQVGKGYALDYVLKEIDRDYGLEWWDAFLVFDADNTLEPDYLREMDKTYSTGEYRVITSYRNSSNYDANWISAGYGLWFIREARMLNGSRNLCHSSATISGTGFLISVSAIRELGGWPFHLLTEDLELSARLILEGEKIGYCHDAVFYDEQPEDIVTSWNQRLRWIKGSYQVLGCYGGRLVKACFLRRWRFQCFDMLVTLGVGGMMVVLSLLINVIAGLLCLLAQDGGTASWAWWQVISAIGNYYLPLVLLGGLPLVCEWQRIRCSAPRKIFYLLLFPVYIFTNIPISIAALFCKVTWKPIPHGQAAKARKRSVRVLP